MWGPKDWRMGRGRRARGALFGSGTRARRRPNTPRAHTLDRGHSSRPSNQAACAINNQSCEFDGMGQTLGGGSKCCEMLQIAKREEENNKQPTNRERRFDR